MNQVLKQSVAAETLLRQTDNGARMASGPYVLYTDTDGQPTLELRSRIILVGYNAAMAAAAIAPADGWYRLDQLIEWETDEREPLEDREPPSFFATISYIEDLANAATSLDGFFQDSEDDVAQYFADKYDD